METYKLGEMEERFANLIWKHTPVSTGDLVKLCEREFAWKRTTTYTMLKRLCDRGIFANEKGKVVALMSREEFQGAQGEQFLDEHFEGSLPGFLAAFTRRKRLSQKEIEEIQRMIDAYREESYDGTDIY